MYEMLQNSDYISVIYDIQPFVHLCHQYKVDLFQIDLVFNKTQNTDSIIIGDHTPKAVCQLGT